MKFICSSRLLFAILGRYVKHPLESLPDAPVLGQTEMSIPAAAYRNHHTDTVDQLQMTRDAAKGYVTQRQSGKKL